MTGSVDSIVDAAVAAAATARASAAPAPTPPSDPEPVLPVTTPPAEVPPPPPAAAPAPDPGAPAATPETTPAPAAAEPTPEEIALADAYKAEGIDPTDPKAPQKLAQALLTRSKTAPAPAAPAPPKPEPAPAIPEVKPEQELAEFMQKDPEVQHLASQHRVLFEEVNKIAQRDQAGRLVGGQLAETLKQIDQLQRALQPVKVGRFEAPALDEFAATEARTELLRLRVEASELNEYERQYRERLKSTENAWRQRIDSHADGIARRFQEQQERAEYDATLQREEGEYKQQFDSVFAEQFKNAGLPQDLFEAARKSVYSQMLVANSRKSFVFSFDGNPQTDAGLTMKRLLAEEASRFDTYHRLKSAQYAAQKRADAAVPAPAPAVAQGTPAKDGPRAVPRGAHASLEQIVRDAQQRRRA